LKTLSSLFNQEFIAVKKTGNEYRVVSKQAAELSIDFRKRGETPFVLATKEFHPNYEKFAVKMRELRAKYHYLAWPFGLIRDSAFQYKDKEIYVLMEDAPHLIIVGSVGSGKSETGKAICAQLKYAYGDEVEFYFVSAKDDLGTIARYLSPLPLAIGGKGDDPLVEVANVFSRVMNIYRERNDLFKKTAELRGAECNSIAQYRALTGEKLADVILVIDEFPRLNQFLDYETNSLIVGTLANMLYTFLAVARFTGVHVVLMAQEARQNTGSMPAHIKSNIPTRLIHRVEAKDLAYLDAPEISVTEYKNNGDFFAIGVPGLVCSLTGRSHAPLVHPYLGPGAGEMYKTISTLPDDYIKPALDQDFIYSTGEERDLQKMELQQLYKRVKKVFFTEAGFTDEKLLVESYSYLNSKLLSVEFKHKNHPDYTFGVGFLDPEDVNDTLADSISSITNCQFIILFTLKELSGPAKKTLMEVSKSVGGNVLIFDQSVYKKPLQMEMLRSIEGKALDKWLLNQIEDRLRLIKESLAQLEELDGQVNEEVSAPLSATGGKSPSITDLNKIVAVNPGKSDAKKRKKGRDFEILIRDTLNAQGYNVELIENLKAQGQLPILNKSYQDQGADLIGTTPLGAGILIQAKCWKNMPINNEVVLKFAGSIVFYGKVRSISEQWIIGTSHFTQDAKEAARNCNIKLLGKQEMKTLIKRANDMSKLAISEDLSSMEEDEPELIEEVKVEDAVIEPVKAAEPVQEEAKVVTLAEAPARKRGRPKKVKEDKPVAS
jgi:HJR/Mrr/RecB family endonuclease